jgi:hypothetical protein
MYYFARIFIEDCLDELLAEANLNNEKLLQRLYVIITQNKEPLKLFISFISILSKLFVIQINTHYTDQKQVELNMKLLEMIYIKLHIFFTKYSNFHVREKCNLDRDELFNIITNFSTQNKELKGHFLKFFVQFFIYVEINYILELEFSHRKRLYIIVFELLYDLISDADLLGDLKLTSEEFIKLLELLVILMKNFSNNYLEDGYLNYKMLSIIMKKLLINCELLCNSIQVCLIFLTSSFGLHLISK